MSNGPGAETWDQSDAGDETDPLPDCVPEGGVIPHEETPDELKEHFRRRRARNEARRKMQKTADEISASLLETAKRQQYVESEGP